MRRVVHLLCVVATVTMGPAAAQSGLDDQSRASYTIVEQDLVEVLRQFAGGLGLPVVIDPDVEGTVTGLSGSFTPREFLDGLAARQGLIWFHDGTTVHVAPAAKGRTVVVDLSAVDRAALEAALGDMGLDDPRLALEARDRTGIGVVSGHPRYVEMVENAYAILAARPEAAEPGRRRPVSVLVIRGDRAERWNGAYAESPPAEVPSPERDGGSPPAGG